MENITKVRLTRLFVLAFSISMFSGCSWFISRSRDDAAKDAAKDVAADVKADVKSDSAETIVENRPIKISSVEEFRNHIEGSENVVVDFKAEWCGPCKRMKKVNVALTKKYPTVKILEVDIDKFKPLADQYGVKGVPTFEFFKDGERLERIRKVGFMREDEAGKKFKEAFGV